VFEAEREGMRQGIRDKYGIKSKQEKEANEKAQREQETAGRVGRQKKTPEEIAAEMNDTDEAFDPMKMVQGVIDTVKSKLPFSL
jgi:complexin-1/2